MTEVLPNKANRIVPTGMLIEDEVATPAEESIGFSVKLKPLTTRFLDVHDQSNPVTPSNRMIRQQTRSSLGSQSNSTNNVNVALVNISVETLINYLTTNIETVGSDDFITKQFEELTCEVLQNNHDPELNRIVKNHGWTGSRYRPPNEGQLDAAACLQEFSNWYLKHKVSSYTSHISNLFGLGDSKGADQILSFCPDTLLKFLRDKPFDHTAMIDVRCLTFVGACMLADISGFSKFSGAMCSKGVSGLDDLREATNGFLGHVVKIVYEFDGDGMYFMIDLCCLM